MNGVSPSQRTACGIVALVLIPLGVGCLGIHKFMMGKTRAGVITIIASLFTCGVFGFVTALAEGIIYLTKSDQDWYHEYIIGGKDWF